MSFWRKLQNPIALVVQGFVAGGILFFATQNGTSAGEAPTESVISSIETSA